MIDFHSHVLPEMDDGANSVETSLEMLYESKKQGVSKIIATPHFYYDETTVDQFLEKREKSYEKLMSFVHDEDIPQIYLGCEVYLGGHISEMEGLEKLCLEGTSVILLEMPFGIWQPWLVDEVYSIRAKRKLIPVIAHVDRYHAMFKQFERMETLLSMEVAIQLNADAFLNWRSRKNIKKIMKLNRPMLIGSDMHDMGERAPRIAMAKEIIQKKFGSEWLDVMDDNASQFLENRLPYLF